MIYMLRGLYDLVCSAFTGGWWFDAQEPLDHGPVLATVSEQPEDLDDDEDIDEYDDDDSEPLPPPAGHDRPRCISCNDPNYSLDSELCIACRVWMR